MWGERGLSREKMPSMLCEGVGVTCWAGLVMLCLYHMDHLNPGTTMLVSFLLVVLLFIIVLVHPENHRVRFDDDGDTDSESGGVQDDGKGE